MTRLRLFWTGSIRRRLMLGVCGLVVTVMAAFVYQTVERQRQFLESQSEERSVALAETLAVNSTSWVLASDLAGLAEVTGSARHYPDLRYVMVLAPDGRVLSHSDASLVGRYVSDMASLKLLSASGESQVVNRTPELMDVAASIQARGLVIGWARVGVGQERVAESLRDITRQGIYFAGVAIALTALLAWMAGTGLSRGLDRLVEATQRVAAGNAGARAGMKRDDELGALSDAFDGMAATLEKTGLELRTSEHELSELLTNMPVAVLICQLDGMISYANDAAREMLGISMEELQGGRVLSPHWRFIREDGSCMPENEVPSVRALESGRPVRNCLAGAVTRGRSEPRWLHVNAYPDLNEDGTVRQVLMSFLDITGRRRAEEDLRERETKYRSLVAAMAEGVCFHDANGAITAINPAAEKLFGDMDGALEGDAPDDRPAPCIHEDGSPFPAGDHPAMVTLRTGAPQSGVSMGLRKRDGSVTWVSINSQPLIKCGESKPYAAVTTVHNITALKQAEQERQSHLRFFESMDRINRAIQGAVTLDQMMSDVLDEVLAVTGCDRAWMFYPCDPEAPSWQARMERTRPEYPGSLALGVPYPMDSGVVRVCRTVLGADGPVSFGAGMDHPLPADTAEAFHFRSQLSVAIRPQTGKPWMFGLHQCSHERIWTPEEKRLFQEIARRLADGLSSLLFLRGVRENEQKYREIFDNVSDSLQLFDVTGDGRFRYADMNPFAGKIAGIAKAAAVGRFFEDVARPEQIEHSLPLFCRCVETGEPLSYEEQIEDGAGFRDLNTVLLPVRNESGSVYRLIVFNRDVTQIKTAERQFRTLVAHLPDYITRLDADARCIYVSPAVTAAFGAPAGRFLGKTVRDVFPMLQEDVKDAMIERVRQVFASGAGTSSEVKMPMPSGVRTMEIRHIPELDQYGKVTSVLSISRDVTERIRMTDFLRQLSAAVEQSPVSVLITDFDGTI